MPTFDLNALPSGLAAGMALPNRASGLADTIRSITNDLRAAASSRQEQAQKMLEENNKVRGQNAQMFSALINKGYRVKPGANAEDFLATGSLEHFTPPPTEAEQMAQIQGLSGGMGGGMVPQGTTLKLGNFNVPLNPPQTPERAQTISALETMGGLLGDMDTLLAENPKRVVTGNVLGVNVFDRKANAIFRQYDKTAAIAAGGKQLTQTELGLIASNRPTIADAFDPEAIKYKINNLKTILVRAHNRLTRGLPGESQMTGAPGDMTGAQSMLTQGGNIPVIAPDGTPGSIPAEDLQEALATGYTVQGQ